MLSPVALTGTYCKPPYFSPHSHLLCPEDLTFFSTYTWNVQVPSSSQDFQCNSLVVLGSHICAVEVSILVKCGVITVGDSTWNFHQVPQNSRISYSYIWSNFYWRFQNIKFVF